MIIMFIRSKWKIVTPAIYIVDLPGDAALGGEVPAGRVGEGGAAHRAPLHGGQARGAEQVAGGALVDGTIGRGAAHIT